MIPLPRRIASLLQSGESQNYSLLRDRGAGYEDGEPDGKFLAEFVRRQKASDTSHYKAFRDRRIDAIGSRARHLTLKTRSRLVIGLGLPQSGKENTAILLDRLTGCPYIPGSSLKGMARQAARETATGALEGADSFWSRNIDRLFGSQSAEGELTVYDAFPTRWPDLELDVLTPHYKNYYENEAAVPADWEDPIPIVFIAIARGVSFDIFIRCRNRGSRHSDEEETERLLRAGLDWIGVGAKKTSGYGSFETGSFRGRRIERWENAQLSWIPNKRKVKITSGRRSIEANPIGLISENDITRIAKSRRIFLADVDVADGFEVLTVVIKS